MRLHGIFLPWCPTPKPWRDALGHHGRFGVWYYLRVFELSASSVAAAAAAANDDKANKAPDNVPPIDVRYLLREGGMIANRKAATLAK